MGLGHSYTSTYAKLGKNASSGVALILHTPPSFLVCRQPYNICGLNAVEPAFGRYSDLLFQFRGPAAYEAGLKVTLPNAGTLQKRWFLIWSSLEQLCALFVQNRADRSGMPVG